MLAVTHWRCCINTEISEGSAVQRATALQEGGAESGRVGVCVGGGGLWALCIGTLCTHARALQSAAVSRFASHLFARFKQHTCAM